MLYSSRWEIEAQNWYSGFPGIVPLWNITIRNTGLPNSTIILINLFWFHLHYSSWNSRVQLFYTFLPCFHTDTLYFSKRQLLCSCQGWRAPSSWEEIKWGVKVEVEWGNPWRAVQNVLLPYHHFIFWVRRFCQTQGSIFYQASYLTFITTHGKGIIFWFHRWSKGSPERLSNVHKIIQCVTAMKYKVRAF